MARPLRIEVADSLYHVFSRGNEKKDIYFSDQDYKRFLSFLEECYQRYNLIIYAYALMKNHYHLLLEIKQPNLSRAIHYLNSAYTSYFNRTHDRVGHLFQGRFKSILVDKENYLLVLSRYIHLNPVRNGFVVKPEEYPWSSYRAYLGYESIPWLDIDFSLNLFSERSDKEQGRTRYQEFVEAQVKSELKDNPFHNIVHRYFLGTEEFAKKVISELKRTTKNSRDPEIVGFRTIQGSSADEILSLVRKHYPCSNGGTFRWQPPNEIAQAAIYLLGKYTGLTLQEIANLCGGGHSNRIAQIRRRFKQKIENDAALHIRIVCVEKKLSYVQV